MTYLIEFRFQSVKIRRYLEGMIYEVNRKFHVGKKRHIPHITLVGPLTTSNEGRLISDFARICSETKLMSFKGRGFGTFDSNRVVYVNIGASEALNEFRIRLVDALKSYCKLQSQDKRKDEERFAYHSTLAMNLSKEQFNRIKNYIQRKSSPHFEQKVMRISLLKRGKILREYDFMQNRLLNRRQALNKALTRKSKELLRRYFEGKYNPDGRKYITKKPEVVSLWTRIKVFFGFKK